jgi:4-hydroxy-3-methylbut-2-enyl diphosphate reductase IspH
MVKVEQLFLSTKRILLSVVTCIFIVGCATSARELPNDYGSIDSNKRLHLEDFDVSTATLTCAEVDKELEVLEDTSDQYIQIIKGNRKHNQVVGYIGSVFFLPVYLATDNDLEAKEKIRQINKAKDELYKLKAYKKCVSNISKR